MNIVFDEEIPERLHSSIRFMLTRFALVGEPIKRLIRSDMTISFRIEGEQTFAEVEQQ